MFRQIAVSLAVVAGLAGCATGPQPQPIQQRVKAPSPLPDKLGEQGLLVATIAGDAVATSSIQRLSFALANVQIDNTYYTNAVHDNHLVLPLRPGDYTLDSVHVYRSTTDRFPTRYPLYFKFHIERDQATNLGTIALVPDPKAQPSDRKFLRVLVDNSDEMTAYLRKQYPALTAGLTTPAPVPATEQKFANATTLEVLRREIARNAWLLSDEPNIEHFIGGEVGTIARLLRNSHHKVAAIDVLDSGTTAAMQSCSGHDERFVCVSSEPALYFVRGDKVEKRALPATIKHAWVHTYPPKGLVVVDQNLTMYSSTDDGATWRNHVWFAVKNPLVAQARIRFANGKNGYYAYSAFSVDPLAPEVLYTEYGRDDFRKIDIPNMKSWQSLVETPQGLLVGPVNMDSSTDTAKLYFRPTALTDWQVRALPGKHCFYLQHDDEGGVNLAVFCDGKFYKSTDFAVTWAERDTTKN